MTKELLHANLNYLRLNIIILINIILIRPAKAIVIDKVVIIINS